MTLWLLFYCCDTLGKRFQQVLHVVDNMIQFESFEMNVYTWQHFYWRASEMGLHGNNDGQWLGGNTSQCGGSWMGVGVMVPQNHYRLSSLLQRGAPTSQLQHAGLVDRLRFNKCKQKVRYSIGVSMAGPTFSFTLGQKRLLILWDTSQVHFHNPRGLQ